MLYDMWVGFKKADGSYMKAMAFTLGSLGQGKDFVANLRAAFAKAKEAGANTCGVKETEHAREVLKLGLLDDCLMYVLTEQARAFGYLKPVLGHDPDGVAVGSQYSTLFGKGVFIWTIETPDLKDEDEEVRREYAAAFMRRHGGADVIIPKAGRILVMYATGKWGGNLEGFTQISNAKLLKRLGSVTKGFQFTAELDPSECVVKHLEDFPDHPDVREFLEGQVDGLSFMDEGFAHRVFDAPVDLDIEKGLRGMEEAFGKDVPQEAIDYLKVMAQRKRDEMVKRAKASFTGSLRVMDPADAYVKGNAWLVPDLFQRFGCHILTSGPNRKKELSGKGVAGGKFLVGLDMKAHHLHRNSRSSTQLCNALPGLFTEEDVSAWMTQDFLRLVRRFVNGQLEEDELLANEDSRALREELGEDVYGHLYSFRTAMESLMEAGRGFLDFRFSPYLMLDTFKAMTQRMVNPDKAGVAVTVPYSLSAPIVSERLARVAGWRGPVLEKDQVTFWPQRGVIVLPNKELPEHLVNLGGADFDDDAHCFLVKDTTGDYRVVVIRYPTDRGEYLLMRPLAHKDVEIFTARKTLKMSFNQDDATFEFTEEDTPVRTVDVTAFPTQTAERLRTGDLVIIKNTVLEEKMEYPAGYTPEAAQEQIKVMLRGHNPGGPINAMSYWRALAREYDQWIREGKAEGPNPFVLKEQFTSMEGCIDLMQQGGSLRAREELARLTNEMNYNLLTLLMERPELPRIDPVFWEAKKIVLQGFVPARLKEFMEERGHIGVTGWVSRMFAQHARELAEFQGLLHRWLQVWQQEAPELAALTCPSARGTEKAKMGALWNRSKSWYTANVERVYNRMADLNKSFKGKKKSSWDREAIKKAKETYVSAAKKMVEVLGPLSIPVRCFRGDNGGDGLFQYLLNDRPFWNEGLTELTVAYFQGLLDEEGKINEVGAEDRFWKRMPKMADCLSFRLIHMDERSLVRWLQQLTRQSKERGEYARKCLQSLWTVEGYFIQQVRVVLAKAFSESMLGGFKHQIWGDETPTELRVRLLGKCRDKASRVLEMWKEGGDEGDYTPPDLTPPPAPPAPVDAGDWVQEAEVARDEAEVVEARRQEADETVNQEALEHRVYQLQTAVAEVIWCARNNQYLDEWSDMEETMEAIRQGYFPGSLDLAFSYLKDEILLGAADDGVGDQMADIWDSIILDVFKEAGVQVGSTPPVEEEPVAEGQTLGERLKALHQELDQEILKYELAADKLFTPPSAWVKWLERKLEGQEVPAMVLREMVQVSQERVEKEIRFNPSQERLQALEDEIRRHFTMGMRGEGDKDFELGDGEEEFRSGQASMTTDSDWWDAYAFNHRIDDSLVMLIADRVYKEVVAEYQASLKKPETVTAREVSLQEAEEMTWDEGMRKVQWGPGIEKWSDGKVTVLLVKDRAKAVEWFRTLSPQQKEGLMAGVTHKVK